MDACINDLSFKGQFKSIEEVVSCIKKISSATNEYQKVADHKPVRRTKTLANRPLIGSQSINEIRTQLLISQKPRDQSILTLILDTLIKGPFIKEAEFKDDCGAIKSICGENVLHSALHAYLSKDEESVHAVISAEGTGNYDCLKFDISHETTRTILNFCTDSCCNIYSRIYEANPKHEIRADKKVAGKVHTKMDLNDDDAQKCLNNGIQILGDKYVYSFANDQWYEFPPHLNCQYHGYPIGVPENNARINRIRKVFGNPPYENTGYKYCLPG